MKLLKNLTFSTQFVFIAIVSIMAIVCIGIMSATALSRALLTERQELTKNAIMIAHSMISSEAERAERDGIDVTVAKQRVIEKIKDLRYGDNEYFFMTDMNVVGVMHPIKPALDGTDLSGIKDPNGKVLFQEIVDTVAERGEGFVDYFWAKPGFDVPVAKISYVKGYEPWGWTIGTGVYVDDIDAALREQVFALMGVTVGFGLLLLVFVTVFVRNTRQSTKDVLKQLKQLETDDRIQPITVEDSSPANEFGQIVHGLSTAQNALLNRIELAQANAIASIKQGLDCASSPILLTNSNRIVSYANQAAQSLFEELGDQLLAQSGMGQHKGESQSVLEMSLDQLHPNQSQAHLTGGSDSGTEELQLGNRHIKVVCTPVISQQEDQAYLGTVVEWEEVTERHLREERSKAEAQIAQEQAESVQKRLDLLLASVDAASAGDLSHEISVTGDDVVGVMANSLNRFLALTRENIGTIEGHAFSMTSVVSHLSATSQELVQNADTTSSQILTASTGADDISSAVETVAAAAEQMNTSIKEIANSVSSASKVAEKAVDLSTTTDQSMRQLAESSNKIGQVIRVITSIAEQTNLLALNATIEAARAGEAGRGFAVVANEVKELAKETARATEDIEGMIASIQDDTKSAVGAITEISKTVNEIDSIQTSIATSIEEQMTTTQEISRSVQSAAQGCSEVADNVTLVANTASGTRDVVERSGTSVDNLTSMAKELQTLVTYYKVA